MKKNQITIISIFSLFFLISSCFKANSQATQPIPLMEHPRPDFQREMWLNLNGSWDFMFDSKNVGEAEKWFNKPGSFNKKIVVPFPWGSKLSGVNNEAEIGWYSRQIEIPGNWENKKIFIVFGASDWITTAWLDGQVLGTFQGGYTPFEFDITQFVKKGQKQQLVVRVDDSPFPYKLEGKQGYGQAKGIWQTVYLDARGQSFIRSLEKVSQPEIDLACHPV